MSGTKKDNAVLLALYAQIEDICKHFKEIRGEAAAIVTTSKMPDATLHLNDVLQATEEATTTILDAAMAIGKIVNESKLSDTIAKSLNDQVGRIYEASSFQDISGQRIKRVLQHLSALEAQLTRLSEAARGQAAAPKNDDPLLNGPALSGEGPSQSDIDNLFNQM